MGSITWESRGDRDVCSTTTGTGSHFSVQKIKIDNAVDGTADFLADLFNCSTPVAVDEVDS